MTGLCGNIVELLHFLLEKHFHQGGQKNRVMIWTHSYIQDIYLRSGGLVEKLQLFEDTSLTIFVLLHIWKVVTETSATVH